MSNSAQHWNDIYQSTAKEKLGWYESDSAQTMNFIEPVPLSTQSQVFIAGAGTSSLVDELHQNGYQLILNDISSEALAQLNTRISDHNTTFLASDISKPLTTPIQVDLWLDRAVLHFLLTDTEINGYFKNLKTSVKSGGFVMLAEFSKTGAKKCAGLPLRRYSIDDMQAHLGHEFKLVRQLEHTFINPYGDKKPYVYGLFQRKS